MIGPETARFRPCLSPSVSPRGQSSSEWVWEVSGDPRPGPPAPCPLQEEGISDAGRPFCAARVQLPCQNPPFHFRLPGRPEASFPGTKNQDVSIFMELESTVISFSKTVPVKSSGRGSRLQWQAHGSAGGTWCSDLPSLEAVLPTRRSDSLLFVHLLFPWSKRQSHG